MMTQEELKYLIHERVEEMVEEYLHNKEAEIRQLVMWAKLPKRERMRIANRIEADCPVEPHPNLYLDTDGNIIWNGKNYGDVIDG